MIEWNAEEGRRAYGEIIPPNGPFVLGPLVVELREATP